MVYFSEFINYSYIMILCQRPKINCAFLETNISILKNKLENIGERTLSISQKWYNIQILGNLLFEILFLLRQTLFDYY